LVPKELVAHGKTRREIAQHISADEVIFQSLEDLQAACIEAAEGESKVKAFEVGVFCGKYVTDVPEGYFEHLSRLRGNKGKKTVVVAAEEEAGAVLIANSGPVNVAVDDSAVRNGVKSPQYREDIRYVIAAYILISRLLINDTSVVFIILQARFRCMENKSSFHVP
jgi:amidophosphoribosyltransferase